MTNDEDINELIEELKQVHIEQHQLNLKQQRLIKSIEEKLSNKQQSDTEPPFPLTAKNVTYTKEAEKLFSQRFPIDSKVRITNRINNLFGRPINDKDRTGRVTRTDISTNRVYIRTDNGNKTWRAPKHVVVESRP